MTTNEEARRVMDELSQTVFPWPPEASTLAVQTIRALLAAAPDHQAEAPSDVVRRALRTADSLDYTFQTKNGDIEAWSDGERFTTDDLRALAALAARPVVDDAAGVRAAIDDIAWGLEHYEPTEHVRRSVRSLRIVLDAARAALGTEGGAQ
jgi:hypothetical protein